MTLLDAVRIVRRFWMTIAACVLVVVGAAAYYAAQQPRLYVAGAEAFVSVGGSSEVTEASVGSTVAATKANAYARLAKSGDVADLVISKLQLTESPAAVSNSIQYTVEPGTPSMQVTVTSTSPQRARDIADAVVGATAVVAARIDGTGGSEAGVVRFIPVTNAVLPTTPASPNVPRILAMGLLAGLALAYAVVMLRLRLDTRIRRPEDITELSDLGLIGTIPRSRDLLSRLHSEDLLSGAVGESLRHLRTNLMFADPDTAPRSVAVTSPHPAEGKSTVSALLARALAVRGENVVLVDGDLRRPMVGTLFDVDSGVGLTQVLSGAVPLDEALVPTDTKGLTVLPAGRIPHNPSEVIGSERMRDLITVLTKTHLVVIDAPPALPVTDAMILSQRVDGLIVVTFMGRSRKEHLRRVLQLAEGVNAKIFGIVLNGIPQGRAAGVYGYESYGYGADDRATRKRGRRGRRRPGPAAQGPPPETSPPVPDDPAAFERLDGVQDRKAVDARDADDARDAVEARDADVREAVDAEMVTTPSKRKR